MSNQLFTLDELKHLESVRDYNFSEAMLLTNERRNELLELWWIPVRGKIARGTPQTCNLCPRIMWAHAQDSTTYYRHGSDSEQILKIETPAGMIFTSKVRELMHWMNGLHAKELVDHG